MPPALAVDREAVRTLCVAIGVREAARRLNIPENTVRQWSCRGKWFTTPIQPPTVTPKPVLQPLSHAGVTTVITPSRALTDSLEEDSNATRMALAKAARTAAEQLKDSTGDQIMDRHKAMHSVAQVAAKVHGWEDAKGSAAVNLNLAIQVNAGIESQD